MQKKADLLLQLLITVIITCVITGALSFVLYARARMKEEVRREKQYLRIHYISLALVLVLGMVYLMWMVETAD